MFRVIFELNRSTRRTPKVARNAPISYTSYLMAGREPHDLSEIEYRFRTGEQLNIVDWTRVVDCAQMGADSRDCPRGLLLPAFISLFEIRAGDPNDAYLNFYLDNFPAQVRSALGRRLSGMTLADQVRECASLTLEILEENPKADLRPLMPGHSLQALLNFESVTSEAALNAALRPHWRTLWRAATEFAPVRGGVQ